MPHSAYYSNSGSPLTQAAVSLSAKDIYNDVTGKTVNKFDTYDIEVTVDKRHKGDRYSSYLWINSEGTIMETPILYKNDKVRVGKLGGPFNLKFTPLANIPINKSKPISKQYQKLFNSAF